MTSTWLTNRQGDWNLHKYQGIPIKGRVEERLGEGMGRGDSRSRSPGHLWEHGSCHCCALMSLTYRHPRLGLAYIRITSFAHTTLLLILLGMLLKKSMWVQARATATFLWTETHTSPGQFHPNARTPSPTSLTVFQPLPECFQGCRTCGLSTCCFKCSLLKPQHLWVLQEQAIHSQFTPSLQDPLKYSFLPGSYSCSLWVMAKDPCQSITSLKLQCFHL